MSDKSDPPKGGGIPAWQQAAGASDSPSTPPSSTAASEATLSTQPPADQPSSPASSEDVDLAKAEIFLHNEDIRDASIAQKTAFLESKGLSRATIDKALASTQTSVVSTAVQTTTTPAPAQSPPPVPSRDVPPIITYPEFLMHAQKPPPIITFQRLLNTAYIALGAAAAVYGTSKYLVKPMSESLNSARHDFASHTQEKLDELNEKLKDVVSIDPKDHPNSRHYTDAASEAETSDSDPTELFHRDFGTQTSPDLEVASDSSSDDAQTDRDPIKAEALRLERLRQICKDIAGEEESERDTATDTSTVIRVLNEQLDSMTYSRQSWTNGVFGAPAAAPGSIGARKDDDEATRMRNEIRAMKGVLLAARNFPASQPQAQAQAQARPVRPAAHGSTAA